MARYDTFWTRIISRTVYFGYFCYLLDISQNRPYANSVSSRVENIEDTITFFTP